MLFLHSDKPSFVPSPFSTFFVDVLLLKILILLKISQVCGLQLQESTPKQYAQKKQSRRGLFLARNMQIVNKLHNWYKDHIYSKQWIIPLMSLSKQSYDGKKFNSSRLSNEAVCKKNRQSFNGFRESLACEVPCKKSNCS